VTGEASLIFAETLDVDSWNQKCGDKKDPEGGMHARQGIRDCTKHTEENQPDHDMSHFGPLLP
jgi:hypothetical protein